MVAPFNPKKVEKVELSDFQKQVIEKKLRLAFLLCQAVNALSKNIEDDNAHAEKFAPGSFQVLYLEYFNKTFQIPALKSSHTLLQELFSGICQGFPHDLFTFEYGELFVACRISAEEVRFSEPKTSCVAAIQNLHEAEQARKEAGK